MKDFRKIQKTQMDFKVGDPVQKSVGYRFPGIVVAKFMTLNGGTRYVVECVAVEVRGCLHTFSAKDLEKRHVMPDGD